MTELNSKKSETLHRICKPLTMIRGYVSLIQEGDFGVTSKKLTDALDIVMKSTNNLEAEVRDLVDKIK